LSGRCGLAIRQQMNGGRRDQSFLFAANHDLVSSMRNLGMFMIQMMEARRALTRAYLVDTFDSDRYLAEFWPFLRDE
jgi:hypothetical protein